MYGIFTLLVLSILSNSICTTTTSTLDLSSAADLSMAVDMAQLLNHLDQRLTYCGGIPRRLHFLARMIDNNTTLTAKEQSCWQSYAERNPNWQIVLWSRDRLRQVTAKKYASEWAIIEKMKTVGEIVDIGRYLLMNEVGGVYADTDLYMINGTLDQLLRCDEIDNVTFIYTLEMIRQNRTQLSNYFFATVAQGDTIKRLLTESLRRVQVYGDAKSLWDVVETTGPMLVSYIIFQEKHNMRSDVRFISQEVVKHFLHHHYRAGWVKGLLKIKDSESKAAKINMASEPLKR